jgi:hypothetical protein
VAARTRDTDRMIEKIAGLFIDCIEIRNFPVYGQCLPQESRSGDHITKETFRPVPNRRKIILSGNQALSILKCSSLLQDPSRQAPSGV